MKEDMPGSIVAIGGHAIPGYIASPASHFADINLLGTEFFRLYEVFKIEDYVKRRTKLYFGGTWNVVEGSKL